MYCHVDHKTILPHWNSFEDDEVKNINPFGLNKLS